MVNSENLPEELRSDAAGYFKYLSETINSDLGQAVTIEFPPNLYNPMRYVLSSKGKRFRPILLIFACESVGGSKEDSYNAALAIEILHNFTLVHDDIMDNDDLRRGRQTVHKKWNESIAILAGDGLIALAYRYLLRTKSRRIRRIIRTFSEAIINICEGQSLDKDMEQTEIVTLNEYLHMIDRKTGVLMAISAEIGGHLGCGSRRQVSSLHTFGLELGIAFQIQDDLLDMISEEAVLGKDLGSDLAQGKKTYPLLLLMQKASKEHAAYLREIMQNRHLSEDEFKKVQQLLYDYDVVGDTVREVNRQLDKADSYLAHLPDPVDAGRLLFLSSMIRNRKY